MNVIHGFWLPDQSKDFIQAGQFCVWVETQQRSAARAVSAVGKDRAHPRQLTGQALSDFFSDQLKLLPEPRHSFAESLISHTLLLPSGDGAPLPCPELQGLLPAEDAEQTITLTAWQLDAVPLPLPLQSINQIHFLASYQLSDTRLGSDFLFWYYFSQSIKGVINKDQYLPGLLRSKGTRGSAAPLYRTWQIVSPGYETLLAEAVKQIPVACSQQFEPLSLLRHFSEVTLNETLDRASDKIPLSFNKKLADSLLQSFCHPSRRLDVAETLPAELGQWHRWQQKITGQGLESHIQLCFRLDEASSEQQDDWSIHFVVASRQQPAFKLELSAYWALPADEKQALETLLGVGLEHQLLLALGSAARIYPILWHGMRTRQPRAVAINQQQAFEFLKESAWVLEDAGFKVMVPSWWTPQGRQRARIRLRTSAHRGQSQSNSGQGLLSLERLIEYSYELAIGDQPVTAQEWQQLMAANSPLIQFRGQWMELDQDKMGQMLAFWQQHADAKPQASIPALLKKLAEEDLYELERGDSLAMMLDKLADPSRMEPIRDPDGLQGHLRGYQQRGVSWLRYLEQLGLNGCLADDMGLGKTIQVIASLVLDKEQAGAGEHHLGTVPVGAAYPGASPLGTSPLGDAHAGPTLLIAPTSVMGNWQKEVEKFAPHLHTAIHHGNQRLKKPLEFAALCATQDMIITSYTLVRKDLKLLENVRWRRIVLDEAQNIKNPKAAQTKAIFKLDATRRLALTGTPVENRLLDLWSIFHFLNPGYLGSQAQFRKTYELPIQRDNNLSRSALLKQLVAPFILRRMKTDKNIIKDLPDKVENKLYCNLSKEQAALYEVVVADVSEQLAEKEGIERQGLMLSTLMKLKQICNHPAQFLKDGSGFSADRSQKLERLSEMLEEALADGDSVLIFTQFTEIGEQLARYLGRHKQQLCYYLHGGISRQKRERMIAEFQDPTTAPAVFVLSLKAGGVGITLTRANHVFHFDRWWNPAVEDQATDRAFRIGQDKRVFVHKFITTGTLEERIDEMIEDKKQLAGSIVGNDESWLSTLDNDAFRSLIALNKQSVME